MNSEEIRSICDAFSGEYTFYAKRNGEAPLSVSSQPEAHRFLTASVIKVPLLFAWVLLERRGEVSSDELCEMDREPVVKGAGFSYLMRTRKLCYNDILLMMIATSDNSCTNCVISKLGFERINKVFAEELGLKDTHLGRKMMTRPQPELGQDNWTITADLIRLFALYERFAPAEKLFISEKLLACEASNLFLREIKEDKVSFYHKTGGLHLVMNDWGFTEDCRLFLFANHYDSDQKVYAAFGALGREFLV